jgi:hypothetical protein
LGFTRAAANLFGFARVELYRLAGIASRLVLYSTQNVKMRIDLREPDGWGSVAVLGRGEGAKLICDSDKGYDYLLLCNYGGRDLADVRLLNYLKNQQIIILANIEEPVLPAKIRKLLSISAVVWAGFPGKRGGRSRRTRGRLSLYGQRVQRLPDDFPTDLFKVAQSTGILGVALAAHRSDSVDIYGIDFYKTDYVATSFAIGAGREAASLKSAERQLTAALKNVVVRFPGTLFYHFSTIRHRISVPNLVLSVKKNHITLV